jgi:hypothetical protein
MKRLFLISICTAFVAFVGLSPEAMAQQKTAKACADEWRADKVNNQAKGITEKAYVTTCRGGAVATPTAAAPAPAPIPAPAAPSANVGQQKNAKACADEWRADKANNQAKGITEKAYVVACRSGTGPTPTAAAPAPAPTAAVPPPTAQTPTIARTAPPSAPANRTPSAGTPSGAGQFASEAQAKAHCPLDTVVWVNLSSKVYHFSGTRNYGNTKSGAYMCEGGTSAAGMRAAKNEKHP